MPSSGVHAVPDFITNDPLNRTVLGGDFVLDVDVTMDDVTTSVVLGTIDDVIKDDVTT